MQTKISLLIREALVRSGMTASRLSESTGISEGRISDYVNGRHSPNSLQLVKILAAAGFRIELKPNLDDNGLILAELLKLTDMISTGSETNICADRIPIFRELIISDGP
jgi:transcriptional regulator with XRE-family HTH domain